MSITTLSRRANRIARQIEEGRLTLRDRDRLRKEKETYESSRIEVPDCKNPSRRERCLGDPELFLMTYFGDRYGLGFARDHRFIIESVVEVAEKGVKQAIAASRGRGKSEIVKGLLPYLILSGRSRFILPIAATTKLAERLYRDFQRKIETNDLLMEDFPEVCWPVRCLQGAPLKARKQHVGGSLTKINWTTEYLSLPHVPGSPYGGVKMAYYGLDAAFRGCNIDGDRPDFVLIDDPETKESAKSPMQIEDRETIIDRDIAGLVAQDDTMGIAVLTTVQNSYCLSARLTDRSIKPSFNGVRFGLIEQWPKDIEMWNEYIAMRNRNQEGGDRYGKEATAYYLANREAMDAGAQLVTDHFNQVEDDEGNPTVYSALQQAFNKIADTSMASFRSEYQNDPEKEEEAEKLPLTVGRVINQTSGLAQGEMPEDDVFSFVGIDIGKYTSHWVKIACTRDTVFWITDYGTVETKGLSKNSNQESVQSAILNMLRQFSDSETFAVDAPLMTLVDSGHWADAIYEFCLTDPGPFYASKGVESQKFRQKKKSDEYTPYLEAYAHETFDDRRRKITLVIVNTEYWKSWGQERFLVDPFIGDQQRSPGSIALFEPPGGSNRYHLGFGRHMISEREELVPVDGKHSKRVWVVKDRNNHYLDAYALACAAAGCAGIRLIHPEPVARPKPEARPMAPATNPYGRPFVSRRKY